MPRQTAQLLEDIGIRILPLKGIDPVIEAADRPGARVRRQFAEQRREQAHLGLHLIHRHAIDRRGVAGEHFRGIREAVPEVADREGGALLPVRVHRRNLHRGELPPGRSVLNGFSAPGPAGAEDGEREEYQILVHCLQKWSRKVTKKWLVL